MMLKFACALHLDVGVGLCQTEAFKLLVGIPDS